MGGLDNTMFGVNVSRSFAAQRLDAQGAERLDQIVDAGVRVEVITGAPTPPEPPTHPFHSPLTNKVINPLLWWVVLVAVQFYGETLIMRPFHDHIDGVPRHTYLWRNSVAPDREVVGTRPRSNSDSQSSIKSSPTETVISIGDLKWRIAAAFRSSGFSSSSSTERNRYIRSRARENCYVEPLLPKQRRLGGLGF